MAALKVQSTLQAQRASESISLDEERAECEDALRKTARVYRLAKKDATCAAVTAYGFFVTLTKP